MLMSRFFLLSCLLWPLALQAQLLAPESEVAEPAAAEVAIDEDGLSEEERAYYTWAKELWDGIERKTGSIVLPGANAHLQVPENFYYLSPADAEKVLTEVWNNPPGSDTLGMLFPADTTPFDPNAWAVTLDFAADGYVSDEDAADIDYDDLLDDMQSEVRKASRERKKQGYQSIELIGWAAKPYYDATSHKMHWAKELQFGGKDSRTLNYNIRVLGRKGVLVLNFIAGMEQLALIDGQRESVLAMAEFDDGYRYQDFTPGVDKVAAYGLGALVAGKLAAKTGALAMLLLALKKFWIFIALGISALFKSLFGRNKSKQ